MAPIWIVFIVVVCVLVLYLLMIKPRNQVNHDWKKLQETLYAHRGLHNSKEGIPENSMAAFSRAVNAGYGIELDVQLTKDRIPVVFHDFTLERMCSVPGKVYDYTYEELQEFRLDETDEKIPLFADFLKLVDGKVPLIIEYKVEGMDFSVCPIANSLLRGYTGDYVIESFNPLALSWYRQNRNDVIRGQLSEIFRKDNHRGFLYFLLTNLLLNWITRPDFIAYNHNHCNNISFKFATQFFKGKPVAWTIRSQQELDTAKENFDIFIFEKFTPNNVSIKKLEK